MVTATFSMAPSFGRTGPRRMLLPALRLAEIAAETGVRMAHRIKTPSARVTCHMWPSGSVNAPA